MRRRNQTNSPFFLIPIVIGLLFAALMCFLAVISTDKARDHYKSQKTAENIRKMMRSINPDYKPPPVKEKSWYVKYDIKILLIVVFLAFVGIPLVWMVIGGRLPTRNPLGLGDSMRRSLLVMVCSFILSPACFFLYIWALRIGLIG